MQSNNAEKKCHDWSAFQASRAKCDDCGRTIPACDIGRIPDDCQPQNEAEGQDLREVVQNAIRAYAGNECNLYAAVSKIEVLLLKERHRCAKIVKKLMLKTDNSVSTSSWNGALSKACVEILNQIL